MNLVSSYSTRFGQRLSLKKVVSNSEAPASAFLPKTQSTINKQHESEEGFRIFPSKSEWDSYGLDGQINFIGGTLSGVALLLLVGNKIRKKLF